MVWNATSREWLCRFTGRRVRFVVTLSPPPDVHFESNILNDVVTHGTAYWAMSRLLACSAQCLLAVRLS